MAGRVYLKLKGKQSGDIAGESTVQSIGGVDVSKMIECEGYGEGVKTAQDPGSHTPTGTRIYDPILIRKWVDKASPMIANSLVKTEQMEGEFYFFRPSAEGEHMEHFFSVKFTNARISAIRRFLPDPINEDVSATGKPALEDVSIVFGQVSWEHKIANTMASDDWKNQT
jgi:type VI secretion system secreted protein Hcp